MPPRRAMLTGLAALGAGCAGPLPGAPGGSRGVPGSDRETLVQQVADTERAFARTMADRDFAAFLSHIAEDAVFLNSGKPLRGREAIGAHWKRFFTSSDAPFAWQPDLVEVIGSGTLAQSIGPVSAPDGKVFARFYSTWRREPDGRWRIVLDNGYDLGECGAKG